MNGTLLNFELGTVIQSGGLCINQAPRPPPTRSQMDASGVHVATASGLPCVFPFQLPGIEHTTYHSCTPDYVVTLENPETTFSQTKSYCQVNDGGVIAYSECTNHGPAASSVCSDPTAPNFLSFTPCASYESDGRMPIQSAGVTPRSSTAPVSFRCPYYCNNTGSNWMVQAGTSVQPSENCPCLQYDCMNDAAFVDDKFEVDLACQVRVLHYCAAYEDDPECESQGLGSFILQEVDKNNITYSADDGYEAFDLSLGFRVLIEPPNIPNSMELMTTVMSEAMLLRKLNRKLYEDYVRKGNRVMSSVIRLIASPNTIETNQTVELSARFSIGAFRRRSLKGTLQDHINLNPSMVILQDVTSSDPTFSIPCTVTEAGEAFDCTVELNATTALSGVYFVASEEPDPPPPPPPYRPDAPSFKRVTVVPSVPSWTADEIVIRINATFQEPPAGTMAVPSVQIQPSASRFPQTSFGVTPANSACHAILHGFSCDLNKPPTASDQDEDCGSLGHDDWVPDGYHMPRAAGFASYDFDVKIKSKQQVVEDSCASFEVSSDVLGDEFDNRMDLYGWRSSFVATVCLAYYPIHSESPPILAQRCQNFPFSATLSSVGFSQAITIASESVPLAFLSDGLKILDCVSANGVNKSGAKRMQLTFSLYSVNPQEITGISSVNFELRDANIPFSVTKSSLQEASIVVTSDTCFADFDAVLFAFNKTEASFVEVSASLEIDYERTDGDVIRASSIPFFTLIEESFEPPNELFRPPTHYFASAVNNRSALLAVRTQQDANVFWKDAIPESIFFGDGEICSRVNLQNPADLDDVYPASSYEVSLRMLKVCLAPETANLTNIREIDPGTGLARGCDSDDIFENSAKLLAFDDLAYEPDTNSEFFGLKLYSPRSLTSKDKNGVSVTGFTVEPDNDDFFTSNNAPGERNMCDSIMVCITPTEVAKSLSNGNPDLPSVLVVDMVGMYSPIQTDARYEQCRDISGPAGRSLSPVETLKRISMADGYRSSGQTMSIEQIQAFVVKPKTSSTPPPPPVSVESASPPSDSGLSVGAIVGISVGSFVGFMVIGSVVYMEVRRRSMRRYEGTAAAAAADAFMIQTVPLLAKGNKRFTKSIATGSRFSNKGMMV